MSFPHSNNSINQAVTQLKEVVARHQGVDHETNAMLREIEEIVSDIERKAVGLSLGENPGEAQINSQITVPPPNVIQNTFVQ
jgi:predicted secreted Zn-dependent protease